MFFPRSRMLVSLAILLTVGLSACNAFAPAPTPTPLPTATPVPPTATNTPTLTPTATVTPSPTPTATLTPTATPSPVPSPTPTVTPGPPVLQEGTVDLSYGHTVNFDNGAPDVIYKDANDGLLQLMHNTPVVNFHLFYLWPLDFADCYNAHYVHQDNAILFSNPYQPVGRTYCFITDQRRVGAMHIDSAYVDGGGNPHFIITYVTWNAFLP